MCRRATPQELFALLAHQRAAHIYNKVWAQCFCVFCNSYCRIDKLRCGVSNIGKFVLYHHDSLAQPNQFCLHFCHIRPRFLPDDEQRALRLSHHCYNIGYGCIVVADRCCRNMSFCGQGCHIVIEQWLAYWYVDMHWGIRKSLAFYESFVYQTVAIPMFFLRFGFDKVDAFAHKRSECVGLWHGLSVRLPYPLLGAVG